MDANLVREDANIMVEVAWMYYEQQLTQAEIGRRINVSRSTVSRLLQEARNTGIVTIAINFSLARDNALEDCLQQHFGLRQVRVLRSLARSKEMILQGMGYLAARLLEETVQNDMVVGVSYGTSIAETIAQVVPMARQDVTIIPIIGALGSTNPHIEAIDLTRELATKFNARYRYLHAPLLVEDQHTCNLLLQEPTVRDVMADGARADCVIIGIGGLEAHSSSLIWTSYLSEQELEPLRRQGAVGHMCAQFFDLQGQVLDQDLNRRAITIGLEALRRIRTVIAVAGTRAKAQAILGALRGGYVDALITDDEAASAILDMAGHKARC
ncbi:MAG: sugar-binding transcriptional regulator [Anaerolineae bacterium]|nr:sugar-binding transcriptional regulator [Anaerolineae bacterium]